MPYTAVDVGVVVADDVTVDVWLVVAVVCMHASKFPTWYAKAALLIVSIVALQLCVATKNPFKLQDSVPVCVPIVYFLITLFRADAVSAHWDKLSVASSAPTSLRPTNVSAGDTRTCILETAMGPSSHAVSNELRW